MPVDIPAQRDGTGSDRAPLRPAVALVAYAVVMATIAVGLAAVASSLAPPAASRTIFVLTLAVVVLVAGFAATGVLHRLERRPRGR